MRSNRLGKKAVEASALGSVEFVDVVRGNELNFGPIRQ